MTNTYVVVFILSCVAASCLGAISRHKRQTASICPQSDGRFPVDGDCKNFMECTEGVPEVKMCPHRLVFNPQTQDCDRAGSVNGCQDQGHPSDSLCDANPGKPGQAWLVAHPTFCNAFYSCEEHFIHKRCEFCGEGTYFSQTSGRCVGLSKKSDASTPNECSQKQLVPHSQMSILELYPDCNLFQSNPFQPLIARIDAQSGNAPNTGNANRNRGNTGTVLGRQRGGQSRGFVNNQQNQPILFVNPLPVTVLSRRVLGK